MIRIAVDAMGGDRGPGQIVAGALAARDAGLTPLLVGPAALDTHGLELLEAPDVIAMHEKPAEAVRAKPQSSLVAAVRAVGEGRADAVVSAGNTGAMLAAGLLELRRIPGVLRPAIAVPIPARRGPSLLIDAGANADARPEHLVQFATMGAVFAEEILDVANPEVRLLSIGEEREKGNQLTLEAHELLAAGDLNFAGNCEGRDLLGGAADVVVTDGFTGNVALKTAEGVAKMIGHFLKSALMRSVLGRVGAFLSRGALRTLRKKFDTRALNGGMFLGLNGVVVKSHGGTDAEGFAYAVEWGYEMVHYDLLKKIIQMLNRDGGAFASVPTAQEAVS